MSRETFFRDILEETFLKERSQLPLNGAHGWKIFVKPKRHDGNRVHKQSGEEYGLGAPRTFSTI
jgi:hypothetical protein